MSPNFAFSLPPFPTSSQSHVRISPRCSLSRRSALKLTPALFTFLATCPAYALSLNELGVRDEVARVSLGLLKARELKQMVSAWKDVIDTDDSLIIQRFIPIWIEPMKVAMTNLANKQGVDLGDQTLVNNCALEMTGHLLELKMEAKGRKKDRILDELEEIEETAEKLLGLNGLKRFK